MNYLAHPTTPRGSLSGAGRRVAVAGRRERVAQRRGDGLVREAALAQEAQPARLNLQADEAAAVYTANSGDH